MSFAIFEFPVTTAFHLRPLLATFGIAVAALRPLLGLGLLAGLAWLFKPLLRGAARASVMLFSPRQSLAQRSQEHTLRSVIMLNNMARELDTQQPNLAAELRLLASYG